MSIGVYFKPASARELELEEDRDYPYLHSLEKKNVPDSYRDTLRAVGLYYFDESFATVFSDVADLRNIVAHEYLDLRFGQIRKFIEQAAPLYPEFIARMKELVGV